MKRSLPPHIAWPLFIVAILLVGIGGAFSALIAAHSDGGAQVIEDYYAQAVAWDEIASRRARSVMLGWRADLQILDGTTDTRLYTTEITVRDSSGAGVPGLSGTIRAMRPQQAGAVAEIPLAPVAGSPGLYRQQLPIGEAGVWDFEVTAHKDSVQFHTRIRREIDP